MAEDLGYVMGQISVRLNQIEARLGMIDESLTLQEGQLRDLLLARAGEKAAAEVERKVAFKIGATLYGAMVSLGTAVIMMLATHMPMVLEWLVPPKH